MYSNIIHFNRVKTRLKNNIYVPVKQKMCTYCNSSNQGAKRLHLSLILTPNVAILNHVQLYNVQLYIHVPIYKKALLR